MAYMGPRFMGGGQIFPQQNQVPFQQLQQQIQAMQRHMQQQLNQQPSGQQQNQNKNPNQNQQNDKNMPPGPQGNPNANKGILGQKGPHNQEAQGSQNQNQKGQTQQKPPLKKGPPGPIGPQNQGPKPNQPLKETKETKIEGEQSNKANPSTSDSNQNFKMKKDDAPQTSLMGPPPPLMAQSISMEKNIKNSPPKGPGPQNIRMGGQNQPPPKNFNNRQPGGQPQFGALEQAKPEETDFYNRNNHGAYNERNNQGAYNDRNNQGNYYGNRNSNRPISSGMNAPNRNNSDAWNRSGSSMNQYGKGPKVYFGHDRVKEKLRMTFSDPLAELEPLDMSEKKFNVNSKLFIGNLPKNTTPEELEALFKKYGETAPIFVNKDASFAFVNFDYKANALKAMREMDNAPLKNRFIKVRFATISEGIRVKNLSSSISNEHLEKCFAAFGPVETCRIIVDERGMSKGEGIVIFREKKAALHALKKCQEECFFLSGALRPAILSQLEVGEANEEGLPEIAIPRNEEFRSERSITPHFAEEGSFEFEFGLQWKQLYHIYEEKKLTLERDFGIEVERLEKKMVLARVEYETDKLRKELAAREADAAQLRRHFGEDSGNPQFSSMSGSDYDDYGPKRSLDQGYEGAYQDPYDSQYGPSDDYDRNYRGGYERGPYDRGYGNNYNREDPYNRGQSMGPGYDDALKKDPITAERSSTMPYDQGPPLDKPYDRSNDRPFEQQPYDRQGGGGGVNIPENFKAPPKRPRY